MNCNGTNRHQRRNAGAGGSYVITFSQSRGTGRTNTAPVVAIRRGLARSIAAYNYAGKRARRTCGNNDRGLPELLGQPVNIGVGQQVS
jgi:hypothetical protein